MRPRIAIPFANSQDPAYSERVAPDYAGAVREAGGEPVEVPLTTDNVEIMRIARTCDGVLLPGSRADVNPEKYGRVRDQRTAPADPLRDNVDELLLQDAYNMRKPILAICFGCQILNVWRSGTLVQHVDNADVHTDKTRLHNVSVEASPVLGTVFARFVRDGLLAVNTSHHQAIEQPGDELKVVARAEDGTIEAVEGTRAEHFVVGVQWHPERMTDDPAQRALFAAFVEAARERHANPRHQRDYESIAQGRE